MDHLLYTTDDENDMTEFWDDVRAVKGYWFVSAELGLWDGIHHATRTFRNLSEVFGVISSDCDEFEVREDSYGNVTVTGHHHDGTNIYELRKFIKKLDGEQAYLSPWFHPAEKWVRRFTRCGKLMYEFGWR